VNWIGPLFLALVAIALYVKRRELAQLQAGILGGSIFPGCVIVEAVVLLLIAGALLFFALRQ